jgi:hypothetical protein
LRLLQLLCEGHVFDHQSYLRSQCTRLGGKSYDLVTVVANHFLALERAMDSDGVPEACQCAETLVDMMQVWLWSAALLPCSRSPLHPRPLSMCARVCVCLCAGAV